MGSRLRSPRSVSVFFSTVATGNEDGGHGLTARPIMSVDRNLDAVSGLRIYTPALRAYRAYLWRSAARHSALVLNESPEGPCRSSKGSAAAPRFPSDTPDILDVRGRPNPPSKDAHPFCAADNVAIPGPGLWARDQITPLRPPEASRKVQMTRLGVYLLRHTYKRS